MKISIVVEFMFWFIIDKVWKDIKIFTIVYVYPYAVPGTSQQLKVCKNLYCGRVTSGENRKEWLKRI